MKQVWLIALTKCLSNQVWKNWGFDVEICWYFDQNFSLSNFTLLVLEKFETMAFWEMPMSTLSQVVHEKGMAIQNTSQPPNPNPNPSQLSFSSKNSMNSWLILNVITFYDMLHTITIFNFMEGLFPLMKEAHCGYTSLHEYVITILL